MCIGTVRTKCKHRQIVLLLLHLTEIAACNRKCAFVVAAYRAVAVLR